MWLMCSVKTLIFMFIVLLVFVFSLQLAYQAWVTSVKTALRERQRHQRQLKRSERKETEREGRVDSQQESLSVTGEI